MIRSFLVPFFALTLAAVASHAATLTCGTSSSPGNPYSGTCSGPTDPFPPTQAAGFTDFPFEESFWVGQAALEFTNGPTGVLSGYFVPCVEVVTFTGGVGGSAAAGAVFGSVSENIGNRPGSFGINTCSGNSSDFTSSTAIPFTFGVSQIDSVSLFASASQGPHGGGNASAALFGLEVFDSAGNLIPATAIVNVTTPEPKPIILIAAAGVLFGALMILRHHAGA